MTPTPMETVNAMCEVMRRESSITVRSVAYYREQLQPVIRRLQRIGAHTMPEDITAEDVRMLLDSMLEDGFTVSTRRGYICALRIWCRHYGNDVLDRMEIRWPADTRPNADWLSEEDALHLLRMPMTPLQRMVVHCELCLGMRRIEIIRLTTSSFDGRSVTIMGKGPLGGKPRVMPYHRDTERVLAEWLEYRTELIREASRRNHYRVEVPNNLLIWRQGAHLRPFSPKGTGIDNQLIRLADEMGVHFSNHTLRRTFGRQMYRAGVAPATICRMLGHDSIDMTLKYIGVDLDDMSEAMGRFGL